MDGSSVRQEGLAHMSPPEATRAEADASSLMARLLTVAAIVLLVAATVFFAIDSDAGLALSMGMAIRDGYVPYRDFFENRTPALHYVVAAVLAVCPSLWLVRAFLLGTNLLTAWLAGRLAQRIGGRGAGRWASLLYLAALLLLQGYRLVNEPFIALLFVVAAWLAWVQRKLPLAALVATAAVWFKQPALLPAAACLVVFLCEARAKRERLAILSAAFLAVALPLALLWLSGAGSAMLDQAVRSNLRTAQGRWHGLAELGKALLTFGGTTGAFWAMCVIGIREGLSLPRARRETVGLCVVAGLALVTLLPNLCAHYFLPAAALGSVAGGVGMARLSASLADRRHRQALLALALLPLLIQGAIPGLSVLKQGYLFRQLALGRQIRSLTASDERILVLPFDPAYYFLSHRYPPVPTFFVLWVNDTPQLEDRMQESLGRDVRIAVIVSKPSLEGYVPQVRDRIRSCGSLQYQDTGLNAEIWHVGDCR